MFVQGRALACQVGEGVGRSTGHKKGGDVDARPDPRSWFMFVICSAYMRTGPWPADMNPGKSQISAYMRVRNLVSCKTAFGMQAVAGRHGYDNGTAVLDLLDPEANHLAFPTQPRRNAIELHSFFDTRQLREAMTVVSRCASIQCFLTVSAAYLGSR